MKDVLVSIVNHHHVDLLPLCLDSVRRNATGITVDAVVLDNASTDGSADMVRRQYPEVELIAQARPDGFAANQNAIIGPRLSKARYVLLLNDDACLEDDALAVMTRFMDHHQEVGMAGARLVYPDGSPQSSYAAFPTAWTQTAYLWGLGKLFPKRWRARGAGAWPLLVRLLPRASRTHLDNWVRVPDRPVRVDWVCGACLMARRETIEQVGLLDARSFFMYLEDVDWCRRASNAGWTVMFVPDARVRHHQHASGSAKTICAWAKSAIRYFQKHGSRADVAIMRAGIIIKSLVMIAAFTPVRLVTFGGGCRLRQVVALQRALLRIGYRAG